VGVRRTRNDSDFWYCMYDPTVRYIVVDENGNETGEVAPKYEEPIPFYANISAAIGQAQFEQFGSLGNYDKVIVTRDMTCPVNETAVLFIDKEPEYVTVTAYEETNGTSAASDPQRTAVTYLLPKYDYIVKRVAKGLDSIAIAVSKVTVG